MKPLTQQIRDVVSDKEIIILSDRYLPKSVGGAELSLHHALCTTSQLQRRKILVVFFDNDIKDPQLYSVDAISVLAMPGSAEWPFNHVSAQEHKKRTKSLFYNRFSKYFALIRHCIKRSNFKSRISAYYQEYLAKPVGGTRHDFLIDATDYRAKQLKSLLTFTKCNTLVADNTRSIIIGSLAARNVKRRIGIVRDNRFHCARHNQSMLVGNTYCAKCDFSCAKEDTGKDPKQIKLQKKNLELTQAFRTRVLKSYNDIIVTSHFLARHVRKSVGSKAKIHRVPNPAGNFNQIMDMCRGIAEEPLDDILVIGMLNEAKGQLELVQKAANWLIDRPHVRIIFAGRGEKIKRAIQAIARKKGITNSLVFLDYVEREQLYKLIKSTKFVLLPNRWKEPFGRVPLEAGLSRKAVVAFGVGGICETIVHEHTGLLVPPLNYKKLLEQCDRLLGDASLRHSLGENAFELIKANYMEETTAQPFMNIIINGSEQKKISGNTKDKDNTTKVNNYL